MSLTPHARQQLNRLFERVAALEREQARLKTIIRRIRGHQPFLLGKPNSNVTAGNSEQVNLYAGTKGSETATGESLPSVFFRTQDCTTSDFVYCYWVESAPDGPGWEANLAECP